MSRAVRVLVVVALALMLCPSSVLAYVPEDAEPSYRGTQKYWVLVHALWVEGSLTWAEAISTADAIVLGIEGQADSVVSVIESLSSSSSAEVTSLLGAAELADDVAAQDVVGPMGYPVAVEFLGQDAWYWGGDEAIPNGTVLGTFELFESDSSLCAPNSCGISLSYGADAPASCYTRGFGWYDEFGDKMASGGMSGTQDQWLSTGTTLTGIGGGWYGDWHAGTFEVRLNNAYGCIGPVIIRPYIRITKGISTVDTRELDVGPVGAVFGDGYDDDALGDLWLLPRPQRVMLESLYGESSTFDYRMGAYCSTSDPSRCYLYNSDLGSVPIVSHPSSPALSYYSIRYSTVIYNDIDITIENPVVPWPTPQPGESTSGWDSLGTMLSSLITAIGTLLNTLATSLLNMLQAIVQLPLNVAEAFFTKLAERAADLLIPEVSISERLGEVVTAAEDKFPLAIVEELEQVTVVFDGAAAAPAVMTLPNLLGGADYEVPLTLPDNARAMMQTVSGAAFYLLYALYLFQRVRGFLRY